MRPSGIRTRVLLHRTAHDLLLLKPLHLQNIPFVTTPWLSNFLLQLACIFSAGFCEIQIAGLYASSGQWDLNLRPPAPKLHRKLHTILATTPQSSHWNQVWIPRPHRTGLCGRQTFLPGLSLHHNLNYHPLIPASQSLGLQGTSRPQLLYSAVF